MRSGFGWIVRFLVSSYGALSQSGVALLPRAVHGVITGLSPTAIGEVGAALLPRVAHGVITGWRLSQKYIRTLMTLIEQISSDF